MEKKKGRGSHRSAPAPSSTKMDERATSATEAIARADSPTSTNAVAGETLEDVGNGEPHASWARANALVQRRVDVYRPTGPTIPRADGATVVIHETRRHAAP
uniref:Uncharacterized protein n=1 Tax=Arundo donax TaxID=35708 RepID=A0A0A9DBS4_ARUDO